MLLQLRSTNIPYDGFLETWDFIGLRGLKTFHNVMCLLYFVTEALLFHE